tara:strand:+ start:16325 stop:17194 length:870 start_codon:yes stop_codon:yes gene_type:complete
MKAEVFEGTIPKNSRKLYIVANNKTVATPHNAFIKIGSNDTLFKIENSEGITIKRAFAASSADTIKIKGNYQNRILIGDSVKIFFEEYVPSKVTLKKGDSKFKEGDILYCQGGRPSNSPKDITGKRCQLMVTSVNDEGEITNVKISYPGSYIDPPENPVIALNEAEKPIEVSLDFELSESASSIERSVVHIESSSVDSTLRLSYELPTGIQEGEIIIDKQAIYLDRDYIYDDAYNEVCSITRDFSPSHQLPLMAPNNPSFHSVYNKAIEMLEEKISAMEQRIRDLERRP